MATTANVFRNAGNGVALVVVATDATVRAIGAINRAAVVFFDVLGEFTVAGKADRSDLRKLYELSSSDTVSVRAVEALRKAA